jgi:SPP1 family predicted phage head-tail adaptor
VALADRLRHQVTIERRSTTLNAENDWGQSTATWPVLATVAAWVQPMSRREQQQASGGGPVSATHHVFMLPADVTAADRLRHGSALYAIDQVLNPAGKDHHLELLCHEVAA